MTRQTLTYDKENDLKLELFLPDAENPPLFIYIHGGGLTSGDRLSYGVLPCFEKLAEKGYAIASIDYRMYPKYGYPTFIEDSARAVAFMMNESGYSFSKVSVGGSSAGSYLSMMLLFDKSYLAKYGIDPLALNGWLLDAGQPTVHFNVLAERGLDSRLVRLDEAAPLWHISKDFVPVREDGKLPNVLIVSSSDDMTCRLEQSRLLEATMLHFKWQRDRLRFVYMNGYSHCQYIGNDEFAEMIEAVAK